MTPWWQVTGNDYRPLTDWKSTGAHLTLDFSDGDAPLQERPARGYDLSLQGALPVLPQVSVEASVSRWMGDHVDVAGGQTTTEQDPCTTGLTLNDQPVPLVTLSASVSAGQGRHQRPFADVFQQGSVAGAAATACDGCQPVWQCAGSGQPLCQPQRPNE